MITHTLAVGQLATNCYLVMCPDTNEALIIDPAAEPQRILRAVHDAGARVRYIVNTHGHLDHVLANEQVREATGAALLIHSGDLDMLLRPDPIIAQWLDVVPRTSPPDRTVADGDTLQVGTLEFQLLHTPGHTPGGLSVYSPEGVVFTGDALFHQGVGRTDLAGGDWKQLVTSIRSKLFVLPDETVVYPGHGPATTIGAEKTGNPFL